MQDCWVGDSLSASDEGSIISIAKRWGAVVPATGNIVHHGKIGGRMDYKAMVVGGLGGAAFGYLVSSFLTRNGCGAVACRINRSPRVATLYYAFIGASLGLTLHAF